MFLKSLVASNYLFKLSAILLIIITLYFSSTSKHEISFETFKMTLQRPHHRILPNDPPPLGCTLEPVPAKCPTQPLMFAILMSRPVVNTSDNILSRLLNELYGDCRTGFLVLFRVIGMGRP